MLLEKELSINWLVTKWAEKSEHLGGQHGVGGIGLDRPGLKAWLYTLLIA